MSNISIQAFFDHSTFTVSYVVSDNESKECIIIDSVHDFRPASGRIETHSADQLIAYIQSKQLKTVWILESHAHADHLSAACYLKQVLGGKIAIGAQIKDVQKTFKNIFNFEKEFKDDGSQFDRLLNEGDQLKIGDSLIDILHTPGHTPACLSYKIEDAIFVGDTIFMPDFGTARTDFPGGDAATLYQSIKRILSLPESTRIFTGHDYGTDKRKTFAWESTVAEQKKSNIHINDKISKDEFIHYRNTRDASLELPDLILPSVQINIRAGQLPPKEDNGTSYLKLPLNIL